MEYQCWICPNCRDDHMPDGACSVMSKGEFIPAGDDRSYMAEQYRKLSAELERVKAERDLYLCQRDNVASREIHHMDLTCEARHRLAETAASEVRYKKALEIYGSGKKWITCPNCDASQSTYHHGEDARKALSLRLPPSPAAKALQFVISAATAVQETNECRNDEDCDHCVLAQALAELEELVGK